MANANSPRNRLHRLLAPLEERLQQHLGVALAAQPVAQAASSDLQLPVVEDLAVVAEHPPAVGRVPGLHCTLPVHDPQPLGAGQQAGPLSGLSTVAARGERAEHLAEQAVGHAPGPGSARCRTSGARPAPAGDRDQPRAAVRRRARRHTCQAWPSSMTLTSPASLPLQQHRLQRPIGPEPAEPGHLDVRRVADAVRAGQQRRRSRGRAAGAGARRCGPGWSPTAAGCRAAASRRTRRRSG